MTNHTSIIRMAEILFATGMSESTIRRLERSGSFPRRRRLAPNSVGWIREEVIAWINDRPVVDQDTDDSNDNAGHEA